MIRSTTTRDFVRVSQSVTVVRRGRKKNEPVTYVPAVATNDSPHNRRRQETA